MALVEAAMADRDVMLATIDAAYAARQRGEKDIVAGFFAPGATYRLVGTPHLLNDMPVGPLDAATAIEALIDQFHFLDVRRIGVQIDGDCAAVQLAIRVRTDGGDDVESELLDLWTFGDDGKVTGIVEFGDTALMAALLSGKARG
jgi:ketosteroid isomerase-like protein